MEKIVLYFYSITSSGGAERRICQLAKELSSKGYKVFLCSLDEPGSTPYYSLAGGVVWWQLGRKRKGTVGKIFRIVKLYHALREHKVKILIGFVMSGDKTIYAATKLAGVRLVVAERNSPQMYWIRLGHLQRWLVFLSMHLADKITVQMPEFVSKYPTSLRKRIVIIPNPVPNFLSHASPRLPSDQGRFSVLVVSRLDNQQKRIDLLINAFSLLVEEFPKWDLHIIGEGDDSELLIRLVDENSLNQRVQFIRATKDVFKYYEGANIFVIPSRWEGFSNALAEAMGHGLPAIGYEASSGVAELIGKGGWLVNNGPLVQGLSDTLRRAMVNPSERQKRGVIARSIMQSFTAEQQLNRWDSLVKSLL
jgi:GalNAc-alpha-(1->4)-GalNAc-alpha-(1->3)-diNAcBac-PP-undecaprenol alpha-1,4-N-acetyl-D-galactosaminyltransferase